MSRPRTAYLSLGSNVGDRIAHLRDAVDLLRAAQGTSVLRLASLYETEPLGVPEQAWFLNTVVELSTALSPHALLDLIKEVEQRVGRTPTYRWGPREIDVDILLYEDEVVSDERLTIPHPRITERLFVLIPLRELNPRWTDARGVSVDFLIERLLGSAEVRLYSMPPEVGQPGWGIR